jgi:uncharacterized protein YcbX
MHLKSIWRYPVKSLAGERLDNAELTVEGVAGDRLIQVRRGDGRLVTSHTRSGLLALHGSLRSDGTPLINGRPWDDPASLEAVRSAAGRDARPVRAEVPERFDILPLLVATDGALGVFGRDPRRLRPNLIIGGVPGLAERDWPGTVLEIGSALVGVHSLRPRCVMTTFDPDTQQQDVEVLRDIQRRFDGALALNAWVLRPGPIALGDPVTLHVPERDYLHAAGGSSR